MVAHRLGEEWRPRGGLYTGGVRVSLEPSKVGWACVEKSGLLGHGLLDGPDKKERFKSLLAFTIVLRKKKMM